MPGPVSPEKWRGRAEDIHALNGILSLREAGGSSWHQMTTSMRVATMAGRTVQHRALPVVEPTVRVAHLQKQAMARFPEVCAGWRVPCLGLTVVGELNTSRSLDKFDHICPYVTLYVILFLRQ